MPTNHYSCYIGPYMPTNHYIQKKMEEKGLFAAYTLHELLDELDVIESFMEPGKAPIQGEVLKKQEQIYRDLDVTPLLAAGQPADS